MSICQPRPLLLAVFLLKQGVKSCDVMIYLSSKSGS